jgi:C-terminal processing protease CtpA/Prc
LVEIVCRLADADELPAFRAASRSETPGMRKRLEAPLPSPPPRLGLSWKWNADKKDAARRLSVSEIAADSPAAKAGLRVGDRIVSVDGHAIVEETILPAAILLAGTTAELEVVRADGATETIAVELAGDPTRLGLSWREDPAAPGAVFVTSVVPYSPAARAGIAVYDRLYSVDGQPFADRHALLEFVQSRLAEDAPSIRLEVETAGRVRPIEVDLRLPTPKADPGL